MLSYRVSKLNWDNGLCLLCFTGFESRRKVQFGIGLHILPSSMVALSSGVEGASSTAKADYLGGMRRPHISRITDN